MLSSPQGPYDDVDTKNGLLHYAHRNSDPAGGDNRKLRRSAELGLPLIPLRAIEAGVAVPDFPVLVVADDPVGQYAA